MLSHADKTGKKATADNTPLQAQQKPSSGLVLQDNRPQAVAQRQLQQAIGNASPGNVVQKLEAPLTDDDIGKVYTIVLRGEHTRARFKGLGRSDMHKFTTIDEDGPVSVHYKDIVGEVKPRLTKRTTEEKPKRRTPYDRPVEKEKSAEEPRKAVKLEKEEEEKSGGEIEDRNEADRAKAASFMAKYQAEGEHSIKFRKQGQRLEMDTRDNPTLKEQMDARKAKAKKKKAGKFFIDPTYHEAVQAINMEFGSFAASVEKELTPNQTRIAYDMMLRQQSATVEDQHLKASGPSPLTSLTPTLLNLFQDMHYKTHLQKEDETSSTRLYESDYVPAITKNMEMSHWRPFLLPADSTEAETSVVNAFGASLDVQTPTSGSTIGQGKIYSAVFKHFQRSMELINAALDKEEKYIKNDNASFKSRSIFHMKMLDEKIFEGLYANEEANFEKGNGFDNWKALKNLIDKMVKEVTSAVDAAPEKMTSAYKTTFNINKLKGDTSQVAKQIELVGTILGLMVKKEKRLLLNSQLFGSPDFSALRMNNLYKIIVFEKEVNKQIEKSKGEIGRILRAEQERRNVKKEVDSLG